MFFISFTQRDAQHRNTCVLNNAGFALKKQMHCRNSVWQMQMEKQSAWHNRKCLQPSRLHICLKEEGKGFQKGKSLLSVAACKSYHAVFLIPKICLWLHWYKEYPALAALFPGWVATCFCSLPVPHHCEVLCILMFPQILRVHFLWVPVQLLKPNITFPSLIITQSWKP